MEKDSKRNTESEETRKIKRHRDRETDIPIERQRETEIERDTQ